MKRNKIATDTKKLLTTIGIFTGIALVSVFIYVLSRSFPEFVTKYYSHKLFNIITMPGKWISGIFPFSISEILLIFLVLFLIISLIYSIIKTIRRPWKPILRYLALVLILTETVLTLFIWGGGFNYNGLTLYDQLEYENKSFSSQELYDMTIDYIEKANKLRESINLNDKYSFKEMTTMAKNAFRNMPERYKNTLATGYFTDVKPALLDEVMCYTNITGIYPYLIPEPVINKKIPVFSLPSTMCHEMAHQRSIAREDEANFISYIACTTSEDPYFQYSGYYMAITNCLNSLYSVNYEMWTDAWKHLSEEIKNDIGTSYEFWQQYQTKVGDISEKVNDTYLQANNIKDGVASYGRLTDLLLADYYSQN